ncbi:AC transposase [Stemphylium lycopersici]|uniref:AC transposase n=1 Tax=Stemphylium lycopersici TaxID=183478 RepID=A0A364NB97_STELY|nr:AC transposase [Stemphylium lycopersici]
MSVPNSLRKLRAICVAIDASPQRFERFIATQQHLPAKDRLAVIRDVTTRWNSTYDMYIDFRDIKKLQLSPTEWHHIELITTLLRQFKDATSFLSQNEKPQIQHIWLMYDRLFDFLDNMTAELDEDLDNQDATEWPDIVKTAAQRGRAKLSKYYAKTDDERGFLFNCATVLDPTTKLSLYEEDGWEVQDNLSYEVEDIFELQAPIEDVPQIEESGELDELFEEVSPLQGRKRRAADKIERRELPKRERRRPERLRTTESPLQ